MFSHLACRVRCRLPQHARQGDVYNVIIDSLRLRRILLLRPRVSRQLVCVSRPTGLIITNNKIYQVHDLFLPESYLLMTENFVLTQTSSFRIPSGSTYSFNIIYLLVYISLLLLRNSGRAI